MQAERDHSILANDGCRRLIVVRHPSFVGVSEPHETPDNSAQPEHGSKIPFCSGGDRHHLLPGLAVPDEAVAWGQESRGDVVSEPTLRGQNVEKPAIFSLERDLQGQAVNDYFALGGFHFDVVPGRTIVLKGDG